MACICFVWVLVSIFYADACPDTCRVCMSNGVCRECEYGWFGNQCDQKCLASTNICLSCRFNVLVDESICLRCPKGQYFAEGKCWDCFIFCDSCIDYMMCTKCKIGYYGSDCFFPCPENCIGCLSRKSCISCKEGWSGKKCQCSKHCAQVEENKDWCSINGTCLNGCIAGKQGEQCNNDCPNRDNCLQCNQFNGKCLKCSDGLYGRICDKLCGHCLLNKKGVVACDIDTGNCPYACAEGYYGSNCNKKCNGNCFDSDLDKNSSACDKESGHCTFGCVSGWYGDLCEYNCSDTGRTDGERTQCFSGSDQNEPSPHLYTIIGSLFGSFITLLSWVTIWFIKRGVCSDKCFSSKGNSVRSSPMPTTSRFEMESEDIGNTVDIYHQIIDTDQAHQTGSGSISNYHTDVGSDQQVENSSLVIVRNSDHLTNLKSVLTSETDLDDSNDISVTEYDIPISGSETIRRHQCDNYVSPLVDQHTELSSALEKQTLSETRQCNTIQSMAVLNPKCHCFQDKRSTSCETRNLNSLYILHNRKTQMQEEPFQDDRGAIYLHPVI